MNSFIYKNLNSEPLISQQPENNVNPIIEKSKKDSNNLLLEVLAAKHIVPSILRDEEGRIIPKSDPRYITEVKKILYNNGEDNMNA